MVKIELNNATNRILRLNCDLNLLNRIREHFSVPNPAFRRNSRFSQPRTYIITPSGKFDAGLLDNIISFLHSNQIKLEIDNNVIDLYQKTGFENPYIHNFELKYRDHQEKSIEKALNKGNGIVIIPTAGGKTLIMAGLLESLRYNIKDLNALVLVLVPTIQLVEQTCSDFLSYGVKNVTKWSGKNVPDLNASVIVAGTQILMSNNTDLSLLSDVKILLVDECHGLKKGNEINKVLKFVNTNYRFGFTGTMPSTLIDEWNIIGKIGPIVYQQKTDDLKTKKYISDFKITILNLTHKNLPNFSINFAKPAEAYMNEIDFLMNNQRRNDIICKLSNKLANNTIVMVDRIDHGDIIMNSLKNITSKQCYYIRGSTEIEERENIRKLMNDNNDIIVVAISKIFSTGINIPNLHNIIFASAGKAKIKIMQSIGRALRLHPTKIKANIFDIADNTKYGKIHLKERINLYKLENFIYEEKNI